MYHPPLKSEITARINHLFRSLDAIADWDIAFLIDKINLYYFTGTMQDGVLVLLKGGQYGYFVRSSYERAKEEALIDHVYPMKSYKEVFEKNNYKCKNAFIETEVMPLGTLGRIEKYFGKLNVLPVGQAVAKIRSVKSGYELAVMREAGLKHKILFEDKIPALLKEGMSEAELGAKIYTEMTGLGAQGIARFSMFQTEVVIGQWGFAENSLYPTSFDGPGGMKGQSPVSPNMGSRERLLRKGDLVFIDLGFGYNGYHTDRTQVYMFGEPLPRSVKSAHAECMRIQKLTASMLKPGNIPSEIYKKVYETIDPGFLKNFMGYGGRTVKFLGHGVGLQIDEYPVIAKGFDEPLCENMVLAVEPKIGIEDFGMVGVEDTYLVTHNGGECLTFGEKEIIIV